MLDWLKAVFEELTENDQALVPDLEEAESLLAVGRAVEALTTVPDTVPESGRLRARWLDAKLRGAFALKDILFLDSLARHAEAYAGLDADRAAFFLHEAFVVGALDLATALADGLRLAGERVEGIHQRIDARRQARADPVRLRETAAQVLEDEHYTDLRLLGVGRVSFVVSARRPNDEERVAIKFLDPQRLDDARAQERFRREVQLLGRLDHPNILPVLDFELGEHPYVVTPFFRGHDLQGLLDMGREFTPKEVARIGAQLCDAVAHAHAEGVVHRGIKPSEVLLDEELDLRLIDFALTAQQSAWDVTAAGAMVGDWLYLAPEVYEGLEVSDRTKLDVFGIGGTLFRLLSGEPPFQRGGGLLRTRTEVGKLIRSWRYVPLEEAVKRCLDEDPRRRPGDLSGLAATLRPLSR